MVNKNYKKYSKKTLVRIYSSIFSNKFICKSCKATAAVEFAILIPLLTLIVFGSLDVISYFRNMQALERTATSMSQIISRCTALTTQDLTNFSVEAQEMVGGTPFVSTPIDITTTGGAFIITGITNVSGTVLISWQEEFTSNTTNLYVSKIGKVGAAPANIGTFALSEGQVLIVVELYNSFSQWAFPAPLLTATTSSVMYTFGLVQARMANPAALETLTTSTTASCPS